jgi:hypothetical protein
MATPTSTAVQAQPDPNATPGITGNSAADTTIGSAIGSAAQGQLASTQLGAASQDQNAALTSLQGILNSITQMLPPNLQSLAPQLAQLAYTGEYSVSDVTAAVQQASALAGVQLDPSAMAAQQQALNQYTQIAQGSGFTPIERAGIAQSQNLIQTQNQGANAAIVQQQQQQGQGGVTNSLAARLISQQGANTQSSLAGGNIAAAGQQRAISALSGEAGTGASIAGQEANLATTKGQAQNTINQYNASLAQQAGLSNQAAQNTAAGQQQTLNTGLEQQNAQNTLQSQQQQIGAANQTFQNQLGQETLAQQNAYEQAAVNTAYGTGEQKAGLAAQTASTQQGATAAASGLTSLYNNLSNSSSTPGTTSLGSSTTDSGLASANAAGFGGATGGQVDGPGTTTSDSIPATLSKGEYVVNAASTSKYKPVVAAINDGEEPDHVRSLLDRIAPPKQRKRTPLESLSEVS